MIYERTEKLKHSDTVRCASHSAAAVSLSCALACSRSECVPVCVFVCVCVSESLCFCPVEGIAVCFSFSTTTTAVAAAVAIVCAAAAAAALLCSSLSLFCSGCICWTLSSSGTKRWYHGRQPYRRLQPRRRGKWPPGHVLLCCCSWQRMRQLKLDSGVAFQYL